MTTNAWAWGVWMGEWDGSLLRDDLFVADDGDDREEKGKAGVQSQETDLPTYIPLGPT